ncbi:hypothetical protein K2173_004265 [Erythroxylum novogranatense]|uniref:Regulator of Vps4 activity in the MVB pathway protein n=1 Tax=Erythroxylum novogranatense TaxID=1862640 RepID=A0AAV8U549_9ROSI|nr:hypothetical protein K2173_004265 [Erythroxylum novogranatense]
MFTGLTKSKFFRKCKSSIKMTKYRLDTLKKKKKAVVKYLKNDIAELIRSGHDYNAFCRAEGLMVEQNVIDVYDFIEQFCGCISSNLSSIDKQRECPGECKEAVHSLVYATARCSDFPELKDLRTLFVDRYGITSETFVNKEFVSKLNRKPATKEMKLHLMHDIAREFSIEWNSKSLEQELFQASSTGQVSLQQDLPELDSLSKKDYAYNTEKKENYSHPKREDHIHPPPEKDNKVEEDGHKLSGNENDSLLKRYSLDSMYKVDKVKERYNSKRNESEAAPGGRKIANDDKVQSSSKDDKRSTSDGRDSQHCPTSSLTSPGDDDKLFNYKSIPPPYVKTIAEKEETKTEGSPISARSSGKNQQDDLNDESKPKPRSVRSRPSNVSKYQVLEDISSVRSPLQRPSGPENSNDNPEKSLKPPPPPGREKVGTKVLPGDDDEETMMDKLLVYYSTKASSFEKNGAKPRMKPSPSCQTSGGTGEMKSPRATKSDTLVPATPKEPRTLHARAASDMPRPYVHPNLPDCDELADRIAFLRGKK